MPAPPTSPRPPSASGRSKREGEDEEAIKKLFTPEFRNRLDATITFAHLSPEIIDKVVEKFVLQLEAQLADRDVTIELHRRRRAWLGENGYDEQMGARPLARVIQEHIKKPLADEMLFGKLKDGGHVRVIVTKDEDGMDKLGFEYPRRAGHAEAGEDARAAPRQGRSAGSGRAAKPPGPRGDNDPPRRGSVPKVPLVKV